MDKCTVVVDVDFSISFLSSKDDEEFCDNSEWWETCQWQNYYSKTLQIPF